MKTVIFSFQFIIQVFVALGAFVSGLLIILYPSGKLLEMSVELLNNSPFNNFLIPGIILLLVNGVGQGTAAVLTIRKHEYAGIVGATFGLGLIIWIFVQVNIIGGGHWLQYIYFVIGVIETALSFLIHSFLKNSK
ncbi:MAG: hypothetical protein HXY50_07900 [Ignavibacteriaceae bacterium]|nr:hypothetical protein [Ignavibacteriaceae bacterium]